MAGTPVREASKSRSKELTHLSTVPSTWNNVIGVTTDEHVWRLATALSGAATSVEVAAALAEEGAAAAGASFANMAILAPGGDRKSVV
jgi:hypothetical protein